MAPPTDPGGSTADRRQGRRGWPTLPSDGGRRSLFENVAGRQKAVTSRMLPFAPRPASRRGTLYRQHCARHTTTDPRTTLTPGRAWASRPRTRRHVLLLHPVNSPEDANAAPIRDMSWAKAPTAPRRIPRLRGRGPAAPSAVGRAAQEPFAGLVVAALPRAFRPTEPPVDPRLRGRPTCARPSRPTIPSQGLGSIHSAKNFMFPRRQTIQPKQPAGRALPPEP